MEKGNGKELAEDTHIWQFYRKEAFSIHSGLVELQLSRKKTQHAIKPNELEDMETWDYKNKQTAARFGYL